MPWRQNGSKYKNSAISAKRFQNGTFFAVKIDRLNGWGNSYEETRE
jgi:hypothetical protein